MGPGVLEVDGAVIGTSIGTVFLFQSPDPLCMWSGFNHLSVGFIRYKFSVPLISLHNNTWRVEI